MAERYSCARNGGAYDRSQRRGIPSCNRCVSPMTRMQRPTVPTCDCNAWRHRLQVLDFALVDLVLYLDAYPECSEALEYYRTLQEERDALLAAMPEKGACVMTNTSVPAGCGWTWTKDPWPWHPDANG